MNVIDLIAIVPYFVTLLLMVDTKRGPSSTIKTMGNASFMLQEKDTKVISMALLRFV